MTAFAQDHWQEQADEPEVSIQGRIDPQVHDAYWQSVYYGEPYFRADLGYEDYAPAYCVGYIGHAQYGGAYADAEKSLCANWLRIKGDSRLTLDEALQAIRAAWDHAEHASHLEDGVAEEAEAVDVGALAAARPARQPHYATA